MWSFGQRSNLGKHCHLSAQRSLSSLASTALMKQSMKNKFLLQILWCIVIIVCVCVCVFSGDNRSPWVRFRLDDDSFYYFHLNRLEGSWEKPTGFMHNSVFLDRDQIQVRHTWGSTSVLRTDHCFYISKPQFEEKNLNICTCSCDWFDNMTACMACHICRKWSAVFQAPTVVTSSGGAVKPSLSVCRLSVEGSSSDRSWRLDSVTWSARHLLSSSSR